MNCNSGMCGREGILLGIKFLVVVQSNWISSEVFDYDLSYCRMQAWLLCIFVPPPTSLIKVVNTWRAGVRYIRTSISAKNQQL